MSGIKRHQEHLLQYMRSHKSQSSDKTSRAKSSSKLSTKPRKSYPVFVRGKSTINDFPNELLLEIFQYLNAQQLLSVACVCKRWRMLANDNLLWVGIFKKYVSHIPSSTIKSHDLPEQQSADYWKSLCIKRCTEYRNKKALKNLKRLNPYTGLPKQTEQSLRNAGVRWQICLVDLHDHEHTLVHRDAFWHTMSVAVRWYTLTSNCPLNSVKCLKVYSINPLFFDKDGNSVQNGPYQRSLLMETELKWSRLSKSLKPSASDDLVNAYALSNGLMVATWKDGGELAFICMGIHQHLLVEKCLLGSVSKPFKNSVHGVSHDDVDPLYGLHHYTCTSELRNMRTTLWDQQFSNLFCKPEYIVNGYAVFPLIRQNHSCDHVIVTEKTKFPWKTDLFKGQIKNFGWFDITVLDERQQPFWCVSSPVKAETKNSLNCLSIDYNAEDTYCINYEDKKGKIQLQFSVREDGFNCITHYELHFALSYINEWFGTSY